MCAPVDQMRQGARGCVLRWGMALRPTLGTEFVVYAVVTLDRAGGTQPNASVVTIGTSAAIRTTVVSDKPPAVCEGLWRYHVAGNVWVIGGALSDGGSTFSSVKGFSPFPDDWALQEPLPRPGSTGLIVLPFINGERSTGYHASAPFAMVGRAPTSPSDVVLSAAEGLVCRLWEIWRRLPDEGRRSQLLGSGTAFVALSNVQDMLASATGAEVVVLGTVCKIAPSASNAAQGEQASINGAGWIALSVAQACSRGEAESWLRIVHATASRHHDVKIAKLPNLAHRGDWGEPLRPRVRLIRNQML